MPRQAKKPPRVSKAAVALHQFVNAVRLGHIVGKDRGNTELLSRVGEMLDAILQGSDPQAVLGLGDRRTLNTWYSPWHRDLALAVAVVVARETEPSIEKAIAAVAKRAKLADETVKDAYREHKHSARMWASLPRAVGNVADNPT